MSNRNNMIPIPGRLHSVAVGEPVSGADEVLDDALNMEQSEINQLTVGTKNASTGTTGAYPYNGMGRVVLPKNMVNGVNTLTQDMLYKGDPGSRVPNTNTIFVISYDYVLGEDITIPANCVLQFDGGSIGGKQLYMNNNTSIIGYGKFFVCNDSYSNSLTTFATSAAGIIVEAVHDVNISGITFIYDSSQAEAKGGAAGVLTYGFRDVNAINITISNCTFIDCGVSINSATVNSKVVYCTFNSSNGFIYNFETIYDEQLPPAERGDGYYGWKCPKNGIFSYNNVINTCPNVDFALMWCSGLDNLEISHNNFTCCQQLLEIYCGDGDVCLRNARLIDNVINIVNGATKTDNLSYVNVCGESYQYPRDGRVTSDIIIERNHIKDWRTNKNNNSAISIQFITKAVIRNNTINGFGYCVSTSNNRACHLAPSLQLYKGYYLIENNKFYNSYSHPIIIANNAREFIIKNNYFNRTANYSTVYWSCVFDVANKVNVSILNNICENIGTRFLCYNKDKNNDGAAFLTVKGNVMNGVETFGFFYTTFPIVYMETTFNVSGALSKKQIVSDLKGVCYKGNTYILNNKQYLCIESGEHYGLTATLLASEQNSYEVEYDSNETMNMSIGLPIIINDTEYIIKNIYDKVTFISYNDVVDYTETPTTNHIIVLDKPLASAVTAGTVIHNKKAKFIDLLGNEVYINASGNPEPIVYQTKVIGTSGNFAGFNNDGELNDSGSKASDFEPAQS